MVYPTLFSDDSCVIVVGHCVWKGEASSSSSPPLPILPSSVNFLLYFLHPIPSPSPTPCLSFPLTSPHAPPIPILPLTCLTYPPSYPTLLPQVMVFLIDFIIPDNYFAQNLYALSADMVVVRELVKLYLPRLSAHVEQLRQMETGSRTSYSSEDSPTSSGHAYEPPLLDVFTVQWFLTLFSISLPIRLVRKVWDTILVEGSEMMIYAALAIWEVLETYAIINCIELTLNVFSVCHL